MRKFAGVLIGIVIVLVAVVLIAPYFIGQQIEPRFRQEVTQASKTVGIPMTVTAYHRHWFGSDATVAVNMSDQVIPVRFYLSHGPRSGLNWSEIHGYPEIDDSPLTTLFNGKPPFDITIFVHMLGGTSLALHSDETSGQITEKDGQTTTIVWGGGDIHVGPDQELTASLPKLEISDQDTSIRLSGLSAKGNGPFIGGLASPTFDASLVPQVSVTVDHIAVDTLKGSWSAQGSLLSKSEATKADTLDLSTTLALKNLHIQPIEQDSKPLDFNSVELAYNLTGLKRKPVEQLIRKIRALQSEAEESDKKDAQVTQHKLNNLLLSYLPDILSDDPELSVRINAQDKDNQAFKSQLVAKLAKKDGDRIGKELQSGLLGLTTRLVANLDMTTNRAFFVSLLKQGKHPQRAEQVVKNLIREQILKADGDNLGLHLHYTINKTTLNGQEMPRQLQMVLLRLLLG